MPLGRGVRVRSCGRPGRLIPRRLRGLRAGSIALAPGAVMGWHSTRNREELLIALAGSVRIETRRGRASRRVGLRAGQCAFVPRATEHRLVNASRRVTARYLYVTGPA